MHSRHLLFRGSVALGLLLSVLLAIETVRTYRYVERDLVREEAHREAERHVRSIVRAAHAMGVEQDSELRSLLCEVVHDDRDPVAWVRVIADDGRTLAACGRGDEEPSYSGDELRSLLEQHPTREWKAASGPVLVVLSPLRLRSSDNGPRSPDSGLHFIEVAINLKGISINFGPLRQDLIVGLSAALALLGTVILVRIRFGGYVHAKQVEKELDAARQVQSDLFPAQNSLVTPVEFAARCIPNREVGGDLYDVFQTGDGETALVLGDVSGKGLPAALLMGLVQGAVRVSCAGGGAWSCHDTAAQLNELLCAKTARERFVTMFWCTFNARTGILRYVNAGHCPPLLVRGPAEVLRLEAGGPVLGVLPGARYEYGEVAVHPGDLLVIFSDGIIEAADADDEEFGEERLISVVQRNLREPAAEICNSILANVTGFLGRQAAQDDQTLVVARLQPVTSQMAVTPAPDSRWNSIENVGAPVTKTAT